MIDRKVKRRIMIRALAVMLVILAAGLVSTGAIAYWTDSINTTSTVETLDIGIEYEDDQLSLSKASAFLPGEISEFSFKVMNVGSISADIKPVITVISDAPMNVGGSEYKLCDEDGNDMGDEYEAAYFNGEEEVEAQQGTEYDKVIYTRKTYNTLYGSVHKDETLDKDNESGSLINEKQFTCHLMLSEASDNSFMNVTAEVSVDTYAIQHSYSEGAINEMAPGQA